MKEKSSRPLWYCFLVLVFMAFSSFLPSLTNTEEQSSRRKRKEKKEKSPSSWDQIKNLLSCKQSEVIQVHDSKKYLNGYNKLGSSCNSLCNFSDIIHGKTRVVHRAETSPESSSISQETGLLRKNPTIGSNRSSSSIRSNNSPGNLSSRGIQLRKLSGCYECHSFVDPCRYPTIRTCICVCSKCGELFTRPESLEHHQAVRHAVSELGPEDSGRNIVEIIFKSSWLKKDSPICRIDRILKVHSTQRTITRFEDYRDIVKSRASYRQSKRNARCAADGNELLRFYCTTLDCTLGANGATNLCDSMPNCGICTIIRHGFAGKVQEGKGVRTLASSGTAHDRALQEGTIGRRAMLVCRVIAGRVNRASESPTTPAGGENVTAPSKYDSVVGHAGIYSTLEELYVFNPRAILPCFVVIYRALEFP